VVFLVFKTSYVLVLASVLIVPGITLERQYKGLELPGGGPATVTLHVIDTYGNPLKYKVKSCHDVNKPEIDLAGQFEGLTFKHAVRWKTYEVKLAPLAEGKQFRAFKEQVFVGDTSTFAVFAIAETIYLPDSVTPWPVTRLLVKPAPSGNGRNWAIVRPAFLPQVDDPGTETALVNPDGAIILHGLHGGRYLITIAQDNTNPKVALVDIPLLGPPNPIEIYPK
jgi:hypothetical protein